MDHQEIDLAVKRLSCALDLKRRAVGVRFLFSREEYDASPASAFVGKTPYCCLVRICMSGYARKANLDNFGCLSAARAFGMVDPPQDWLSGRSYAQKGMYRNLGTAKKVVNNTTCVHQKAYGIEVMPVELFEEEPHVVILATTPYNMMRLVQGYTYMFGTYSNYKIIGNQALCSECTAYPFESNNVNLSVMCSGTRYMAGWGKDEMGMGIPYHLFPQMVEGLWRTMDVMEKDADKERILVRTREMGFADVELHLGQNYFTGQYLK